MKLRYYMRGLAVGILVTTIILTIVNAGNKPLTDAQIRQRALELGMIENDTKKLSSLRDDTLTGNQTGSAEPPEGSTASESGKPPKVDDGQESTEPSSGGDGQGSAEPSKGSTASESGKPSKVDDGQGSTEPSKGSAASESGKPSKADSQAGGSASATDSMEAGQDSTEGTSAEPGVTSVTIKISGGDSSYSVSKKLAAAGLVEDAAAFDTFLCDNGYSRSIHTGTYEILPGTSQEEIAKMISG